MWGDVRQIDVNLSGISMPNDQANDYQEEVGVHTEYIRFGLIGNITLFVLFRSASPSGFVRARLPTFHARAVECCDCL
ncbi:uncharacterized protein LOC131318401 isoform X2 [Rhododendron vialii]|uniref:uncharacterized protein LOC131318401 isoform X2 n=1 Tax=Rhododendron vialii TaxID=182163 RepID=UPI00265DF25F|nr:uncharacterized protein LOC131318401 isoform X2 [Rhododendron vialii]